MTDSKRRVLVIGSQCLFGLQTTQREEACSDASGVSWLFNLVQAHLVAVASVGALDVVGERLGSFPLVERRRADDDEALAGDVGGKLGARWSGSRHAGMVSSKVAGQCERVLLEDEHARPDQ